MLPASPVAVTDTGVCYSYGSGSALGLGPDVTMATRALPVRYLKHYRVVAVACGAEHTLAIAQSIPADERVRCVAYYIVPGHPTLTFTTSCQHIHSVPQ